MHPVIVRLLLLLLLPGLLIPAQADNRQIRQTMREAFDAVAYLLPLSLRGDDTISTTDRELIDRYVGVLADSEQALIQHGENLDPEFALLSRSYERAVQRATGWLAGGSLIDAYFALSDLTENCVSCHTRLPDDTDFLFGQTLFARMDLNALEPDDIARLYIATRQFGDGLTKLEEIILDESTAPVDLDLNGTLIDYLQVAITVTRDLERVRRILGRFSGRGDVPLYLRHHVKLWQVGINELAGDIQAAPTLDRARTIFTHATGLTLTPAGRERAVHDIVAAGILRRWLELGGGTPEQNSEAYYLLGMVALRTLRPRPSVPELEFLLESSVRAAPKGPFATAAYRALEEFSHSNLWGFGASELLNPDVDLEALRALVE